LRRSHSREHSRTPVRDAVSVGRLSWYRRAIPWWAVIVTVLVLVTSAFAIEPIRDAALLIGVGEARLDVTAAYLSIAPISAILDTLTLLTVGQHIALLLWAIALFAAWRTFRERPDGLQPVREAIAAGVFLVIIFAVYAVGAMVPRPMARIALSDETVLAVDFHTHTKYSHDGRSGWSDDKVRAWENDAGFDAAYITDHRTFEGAERGVSANPGVAGEGTLLFQGLEAGYKGEHVNILSAGRRYKGVTTPDLRDVDEQSLNLAYMFPATSPVLIETLPGNIEKLKDTTANGVSVVAMEIIDGSPRGLAQGRRDRSRVVHLADSLNLALVTGTDNHGWGRAAPGWTLLRIPGWRGMTTDSLSRRIEDVIRVGRRSAARPVERIVGGGQNPVSLALTPLVVTWRMLTTLSADERVMWIIWTWAIVLVARTLRRYRSHASITA
jgi:hypothetical protein